MGVFGVDSSTPRHVIVMGNIMCSTQALLGLSLEPLFYGYWEKDFYHQATPHMVK